MIWSKLYSRWRDEFLDPRLIDAVAIQREGYHRTRQFGKESMTMLYIKLYGETVLAASSYNQGIGVIPYNVNDVLRTLMEFPFDDCLKSEKPMVRAFAYLDRRFGKRRSILPMLTETDEFARACLKLKMSVLRPTKRTCPTD